MGKYAGKFINDGDNIILDSGTSTVHIVEAIFKKNNITVITNDINIAEKLRFSPQIKVIVTGGNLFPESYMLNGFLTDQALGELYVDTVFLATPAFHPELGLSHFDEDLISAKKSMIEAAKKVIVVADHTKIGKVSLYKVTEINKVHALITTNQLDKQQKKSLEELNMDVYIV